MIVVDSSFLVALFHEKDEFHKKAIEDMRNYEKKRERFIISEHVLGETATVLLYYAGLKKAVSFIEYVVEYFEVHKNSEDYFQSVLSVFKKQKHELSYVDASVVSLANFYRCPAATYDKNILKEISTK